MRVVVHSWLAVGLCLSTAAVAQGTLHVARCGNDAWTGTSATCSAPNGPKLSIQSALRAASPGTTILVQPGSYPPINVLGDVIVRSTGGPAVTTIGSTGTAAVFGPQTTRAALLEGFTVHAGDTGISVDPGGSPTILDCRIQLSPSTPSASGVHLCTAGSPLIDRCTFLGSGRAVERGISNLGATPVVRECVFDGCTFSNGGNCNGGPWNSADAILANCSFEGGEGPAFSNGIGNPSLVNCVIRNYTDSFLVGAAILNSAGTVSAVNCTVFDNQSRAAAISNLSGGSIDLVNSIVWTAPNEVALRGNVTAAYSIVSTPWPGIGNCDGDPLLDAAGRPAAGSPAIDSGDDASLPADRADIDRDGNTTEPTPLDLLLAARRVSTAVDRGAFEDPSGGGRAPCVQPCGFDAAACARSRPERYRNRGFVGYLVDGSLRPGTGIVIATDGSESVVLTANHVIAGRAPTGFSFFADFECAACGCGGPRQPQQFPVTGVIHTNANLDYALLRVGNDPARTLGVATLDASPPRVGESVYSFHHGGDPASPGIAQRKAYTQGTVVAIGQANPNGCPGTSAVARLDLPTSNGASGGPVFRATANTVAALIRCGPAGGCTRDTRAVPMADILNDALAPLRAAGFGPLLSSGTSLFSQPSRLPIGGPGQLQLFSPARSSAAAMFLDVARGSVPIPGFGQSQLALTPALVAVSGVTNSNGSWSLAFVIPGDPALASVTLFSEGFVLDALAPNGGFRQSNLLEITFL